MVRPAPYPEQTDGGIAHDRVKVALRIHGDHGDCTILENYYQQQLSRHT